MIQVTVVTNLGRSSITVDENKTIRAFLEENNVKYGSNAIYIDGAPLQIGDHDKTFSQIGITDKCMLTSVIKTDNAKVSF